MIKDQFFYTNNYVGISILHFPDYSPVLVHINEVIWF